MNVYENDYSYSSSIITKVITFYFDQIWRHHIIQNKFKIFSRAHQINFVQRQQNPSNVSRARPNETIWSLLE